RQVSLLDEGDPELAAGGVARDAHAVGAAAHDEKVEAVVRRHESIIRYPPPIASIVHFDRCHRANQASTQTGCASTSGCGLHGCSRAVRKPPTPSAAVSCM